MLRGRSLVCRCPPACRTYAAVRLLVIVVLVGACHQSKPEVDLSRVSGGMTKADVIDKLGPPDHVAAQGRVEYLEYDAYDDSGWDWKGQRNQRTLYVRIVDGVVESYGKKGDFGTTRDPTVNVNVNERVEHVEQKTATEPQADQRSNPNFDLATELKKLDTMKRDGLISDAEYEDLRRRAIEKAKDK